MKLRSILIAALVAAAPLAAVALAQPAGAAECAARDYNVYNPLNGERLVAAEIDVYTSPLGSVVANPQACVTDVTGYTGTATGANVPGLLVGSAAQSCFVPGVGCIFNYDITVDVNGSPAVPPVATSNTGPVCVGTVCPGVMVDTGLDVTIDSHNNSAALILVPTINTTQPICVRVGTGFVC